MLVLLGLMALALALYANALRNPFLIDDLDAIVSHPDVVEPGGIVSLWGHDYWAGRSPEDRNLYRPIVIASYWLNARITGLSPTGFRIVNVALLATLAWLLYLWLTMAMRRSMFKTSSSPVVGLSMIAVLLVLTHPAHATVVNNVVGRADLLAMVGVMGFAVLHQQAIARDRWRFHECLLAAICVFVAVASKETGLLVVPVALTQWWLGWRHWNCYPRPTLWLVATPAILYLISRVAVIGATPHYGPSTMDLTGNPLRGMSLVERSASAIAVGGMYLGQLFWPTLQASFIPDKLPTWSGAEAWFMLFWLGLAIWLTWSYLRLAHWAAPMLVMALCNYLLIGNLLMPIGVYAGYRLMIPFAFGFIVFLVALAEIYRFRRAVMVVLCALALAGGVRVILHNREWRDHVTLMKANLDRQPDNTRAAFLYGVALGEQNRQREGIEYVAKAVQRHPTSRQARHEYGKMLIVLGQFEEAIVNYEALLQSHPQETEAMTQLAGLFMVQHQYAAAGQWLNKALTLAPTNAAAMHNAAVLAALTGQINEAILRYEALLREHPEHTQGRAEYDELRRHLSQP